MLNVGGGGLNKHGVSSNINPRLVDNHWFSTFKVVSILKQEIFSDLFLIKMVTPASLAGKERVLRKIRKVIFKDHN
jgi:hypothetical protein